jgi:hypothetical protein
LVGEVIFSSIEFVDTEKQSEATQANHGHKIYSEKRPFCKDKRLLQLLYNDILFGGVEGLSVEIIINDIIRKCNSGL